MGISPSVTSASGKPCERRITLTGAARKLMLGSMKSRGSWKTKPELTARCPNCKELFPLGYNFCPDCGRELQQVSEGPASGQRMGYAAV